MDDSTRIGTQPQPVSCSSDGSPCLVITGHPDATLVGKTLEIPKGKSVLGRGAEAALRVDDQGVSRRHAEVLWSDEGYQLVDLGSTNGTHVNGVRIGTAACRKATGSASGLPSRSSSRSTPSAPSGCAGRWWRRASRSPP